jgi:hypothetical protein
LSQGRLKLVTKPEEYFETQVSQAVVSQKLEASPEVSVYLVNLLSQFTLSNNLFTQDENGNLKEEVLTLLLAKAVEAVDIGERLNSLKRLGDISLYTAGFFPDRLSKKVVDVDYYIQMGRNAYSGIAQLKQDSMQTLYEELSKKFHKLVDVLAEVSAQAKSGNSSENILRTYEIWLKTRSKKAEKDLKKAGIIPNKSIKKDWQ